MKRTPRKKRSRAFLAPREDFRFHRRAQRAALLGKFRLGQRGGGQVGETIRDRPCLAVALQHVIDEQAADLVAWRVEVEQLHRALLRLHGTEVESEPAPDDAVRLKKHEVELERLVDRRAVVGDDDIGPAALLLNSSLFNSMVRLPALAPVASAKKNIAARATMRPNRICSLNVRRRPIPTARY